MQKERWRIVPSLPRVMVSNNGRVMLTPKIGETPHGGIRQYGGEPIYGQWDGERYLYVLDKKTYKVARLVCEAFNGFPPNNKNVCMHLDEDSRNNKPENLRWGTQKENLNFPSFLAYCSKRTGENNPMIKGRKKHPI